MIWKARLPICSKIYRFKEHTNMRISTETLYRLCNKYQWFTSGDCTQYEKLFEKNKQGASLETLATIIWLCSVGYEEKQILEILEKECKNND